MLWATVLERFHSNSLLLQKEEIDFSTAVSCYRSLITFTEALNTRFEEFEAKAMNLLGVSEANYREDTQRRRGSSGESDRHLEKKLWLQSMRLPNYCIESTSLCLQWLRLVV